MKVLYRNLSALMFLILLSGCGNATTLPEQNDILADKTEEEVLSLPQENAQVFSKPLLKTQNGKTRFLFSAKENIEVAPGDEKVMTVMFSPQYEPISSLQIVLKFDPRQLSVSDIKAAAGISPFYQNIDAKKGQITFVAAAEKGLYGSELPAFSFQVIVKKTADLAETVISFVPEEMSALLPNIDNTETAIRENLPRLVFSVR